MKTLDKEQINTKNKPLMGEETKFQRYFKKKKKIGGCILITTEYKLFEPMNLLSRDFYSLNNRFKHKKYRFIGRIDLIFRRHSKLYAGEIKWFIPKKDFWDALKIIGYSSYFDWQNETTGNLDRVKPAIFIPLKHIKLEHKIICNKLGIALFGIIKDSDNYSIDETLVD